MFSLHFHDISWFLAAKYTKNKRFVVLGSGFGSETYVFLAFYWFWAPEPMFSLRFIGSGLRNLCFPCISMIFPGFGLRNIQKNKRFVVLGSGFGSETCVFLAFYWF